MAESQLILKPVGPPPDINISELARQAGVSRATVRRRLADGWSPEDLLPVKAVEIPQCGHDVATPGHPVRPAPGRHWILGLASGALGLALAGVGLVINARYAACLGATAEDSWLLATLGLAIDAGAVIGLSVTALLWQVGRFLSAVTAFVLWVGFSAMSAIATAGFTSQSIGDFAAGRASVIGQAADLRTQRLEAVAAAKMALASAMAERDAECGKVGPRCKEKLAAVSARNADVAAAIAAPAVTTAPVGVPDPGAHMLAGLIGVSQASIQKLRIAGLTVAPITAGVFLAFAAMLLGGRRG